MTQPSNPLYREIKFEFDFESLTEAVKNTDIGEGSYLSPIQLDPFVINDLKNFFDIEEGNGFKIYMDFKDVDPQPECHYLRLQNKTKLQSHIMTPENWGTWFDIKENVNVLCAPDGSMFLKPYVNNDGLQSFEILTKESDPSTTEKDIYISYTIVLSLFIDDKTYFFKIDPLVKISSKKRPPGLSIH